MADIIFPKGVRFFDPHPNAPKSIKGSVVIALNELVQFCKDNPDLLSDYKGVKQIKLQLVEKKQGGLFLSVDTYKKENKEAESDLPF